MWPQQRSIKEYCGYHGGGQETYCTSLGRSADIQATVQAIQQTTQSCRQDLIDTCQRTRMPWTEVRTTALEAARVTACNALAQLWAAAKQQDAVDASAECVKAQQQAQD